MSNKYFIKIAGLWLILIYCFGTIYAQEQTTSTKGGASSNKETEVRIGNLAIEQIQISMPKNYAEVVGNTIAYRGVPNLLLKVIDKEAKKSGQKADTLGVIYVETGTAKGDALFTRILPGENEKIVYIAVVLQYAATLSSRIYQLNLSETSLQPLILDEKDYRKWQRGIPVRGNFSAKPNRSGECQMSDFQANRKTNDIIDFSVKFEAAKGSSCEDFNTQFFLRNNTWTGETLDVESYPRSSEKETLELKKTRIVLSKNFNPLLFETYARNRKQMFPNWVFYLVRSQPAQAGNNNGFEVVWLTYKYTINSLTSNEDVLGAVAINPATETAYIALISDGFTTPKLEIYETKINKSIASYPLELNQESYVNWTPGGKPLAETEVRPGLSCGIEQVDLKKIDERLVVTINQKSKWCESKNFIYDISGKTWVDK